MEDAVPQGIFVNHVECNDIGTRPSTVGAVFYPTVREDQPCDLDDTKKLVTGSSSKRPVFFYSPEETSIPRWLHEMYVPFNTSVNVILQDKLEAGWLTLQEVYHLDNQGSDLIVNNLGRREIDSSNQPRWQLTTELKLTRRANLYGSKIRTVIIETMLTDPTSEVSLHLLDANKTIEMACNFLNASVQQLVTGGDLIKMLETSDADVVMYPVTIAGGYSSIGFTFPFNFIRYRLFIRKPVFVYSLDSVVKSFSLTLWITIGVTVITLSAAMTLTSHVAESLDLGQPTTLSECFLHTLGSACAQGWTRLPDSKSGRCVLMSTVLTGFLLNTYFVMQLQSGLSAQTAPLPFRGLEELVQTDYQIYMHPGGHAAHIIGGEKTEVTRKAKKKSITEKARQVDFDDINFCEKRIALLEMTFMYRIFASKVNCTIVDTKENLFSTSISFPIRKNYQFQELIDYSFLRAAEGGLIQRNDIRFHGPVLDGDEAESFQVVELNKVKPFLLIYGFTLAFSLAVFFVELACFHWLCFH